MKNWTQALQWILLYRPIKAKLFFQNMKYNIPTELSVNIYKQV